MLTPRSPPRNQNRDNGANDDSRYRQNESRNVRVDENLPPLSDDPRLDSKRNIKIAKTGGGGRNTESFDPKSTFVRPEMRVIVAPNQPEINQVIKHDDIIMVPEFFCKQDDWQIYYKLVEEMREIQEKKVDRAEWISWHEGAHLISQNPAQSKTFQDIQAKISAYFGINNSKVGTRFNWYRDSSDWKPFHHDSAAFNPQRAKNQNITVGVSLGATRELAFLHAKNGTKIYFPQTNGMMFAFGRDVNINWKHGVNALPEAEQDGKGRISIVLWGNCPKFTEESGSPPMLTDNSRGLGHNIHNVKRDHHLNGNNQGSRDYRGGGHGGDRDDRNGRREGSRDRRPRDNNRDDRHRHDDRDRNQQQQHQRPRSRDRGHDRNGHDDRRNDDRDCPRHNDRDRHRDDYNRHDNGRYDDRGHNSNNKRPAADFDPRYAPPGREEGEVADSSRSTHQRPKKACRDFQQGNCTYGSACKFAHDT